MDHLLTSAEAGDAEGRQWKRRYRWRLFVVDALVIIGAVALAQYGRFWLLAADGPQAGADWTRACVLSVLLAVVWFAALSWSESRDLSLVGVGSEEYRRVVSATAWVFGITAIGSLILQTQVSRGYLLIALPVGLVGLVMGRHLLRRGLGKRRTRGEFMTRVVALGGSESVGVLCDSLCRSTPAGYRIVGVCIPDFDGEAGQYLSTPAGAIPVLGDENSVEIALRLTGADALAVTAVERLGQENMRKLAWRLDSLGVDMIVVPGMTDIAGPRLKLRPIDNLPLFHIARPRYDGPSSTGKRAFDIIFALLALPFVLLVMAGVAIAIKLDDGGPVFYRQMRVGQHGKRFRIWKFRTMMVGADAVKSDERASAGALDAVFFKSASDSRITSVGRVLRAASIDELPQLFNVLDGSMSIVGPRPLVPGEGDSVEHFVQRRALVKPGMTGLWQVSGRSDVSEEERIRLDHSYVDNWSSVQDLIIVWRTIRAVLKREGAY
ncbi:exopolysaccharide biosynthesis polyprenyl glycosylphosphotransferase [Mycobacterium frederiksbergense]|uniref:Exopolysaccharide biosynthesis polyprenyl glycosylphosphotransferase n=1 Tax=Mycolicibacterium frederiksbergense TaxID=117567 RepID=A0ABT6L1H3_9MYCO|nr:sugar transferase [Mycolicibacterium frederiksbergense]MDH6196793.1 exopolysaccharide biosynthesis polyprenyl glycosylphosphotransferase [Mycolicibacterium frederiksbergense]